MVILSISDLRKGLSRGVDEGAIRASFGSKIAPIPLSRKAFGVSGLRALERFVIFTEFAGAVLTNNVIFVNELLPTLDRFVIVKKIFRTSRIIQELPEQSKPPSRFPPSRTESGARPADLLWPRSPVAENHHKKF